MHSDSPCQGPPHILLRSSIQLLVAPICNPKFSFMGGVGKKGNQKFVGEPKQGAVNKYDLTVFIRHCQGSSPPGGRSGRLCVQFFQGHILSTCGDASEPVHINYSFTSFFIIFTFFFFFFFENNVVEKNDALFNQQYVCVHIYSFVLFFLTP